MDAILLVGGLGTRLLPLTKRLPKPLIPLANIPFVERTVAWLRDAGVDHIILSLFYNSEQFIDYFTRKPLGVDFSFAVEGEPLGTGGAIKNCEPFLRSDALFVVNGDIFTNINLQALREYHRQHGARATLALTAVEDPSRFGVIETREDGRIVSFTEKPPKGTEKSRNINAGIYLFTRAVFDWFPAGKCSVERDVFPVMLAHDVPLHGYHEWAYWTDLGTVPDYLQAHRDILRRKVRVPLTAREVSPGVWVGDRAHIADSALLRPPVVIGHGARVAAHAIVGPLAVLGHGVNVGQEALVTDSVVWEHAQITPHSSVEGSILGRRSTVIGHATQAVCADQECLNCADSQTKYGKAA